MKIVVLSSVHLLKPNGMQDRFYDFSEPKDAIQFLDTQIRSDEYVEGYIKVLIKKGK